MGFRLESDVLGEVMIPKDSYWGTQTQRSIQFFKIGEEKFPLSFIHAFAILKKAAAQTNFLLGKLSEEKKNLIIAAADEIIAGKFDNQFPLVVWQTGSGTQTNMNVNEVIANRANQMLGKELGSLSPINPHDDVNQSQSSNDAFPTAMHITAVSEITHKLFPSLENLIKGLEEKSKKFSDIVKIGRTHLMDAVPLTLGQEFSGYTSQLKDSYQAISDTLPHLLQLALGGSAVGTGLNTHHHYAETVAQEIARLTALPFTSAENKFAAIAAHDAFIFASGALKRLACSLMKIASDIRLLASGPRCGLAEITIPSNEPGSSIMPGKVNPTQSEAMTMVCMQVMGNDAVIGYAGALGQLELNAFKPVIIHNFMQSVRLLTDAITSFHQNCVQGIEARADKIKEHLNNSLMLATVLNQKIGHQQVAQAVQLAQNQNKSLREAILALGLLSEKEFDELVVPEKMTLLPHPQE